MILVGFTGTKRGMTAAQKSSVLRIMQEIPDRSVTGHHGDCVGADAEFHLICRLVGARVHLHPPKNPSARAFCEADWCEEERDYLVRNQHIVRSTSRLIATPGEDHEMLRSGTWSTIRYARKSGRPVMIVLPSGATQSL